MKTLSIRQPFATLVCAGVKDVENRTWNTDYRGTLLIHASSVDTDIFDKSLPLKLFQEFDACVDKDGLLVRPSSILDIVEDTLVLLDERYRKEFNLLKNEIRYQADLEATLFGQTSIIGQVDLVDVRKDSTSAWSIEGQYHWVLENAVLYRKPVFPIKGSLRLWTYDGTLDKTKV